MTDMSALDGPAAGMAAGSPAPAHFIDGIAVAGGGPVFASVAPATGRPFWRGRAGAAAEAQAAARAAARAFPAWAATPLAERIAAVERFGAALADGAAGLAGIIAGETGKPLWDAHGEVAAMRGKIALSVRAHGARTGTGDQLQGALRQRLTHRPHGVMLVLGPFNFPGHLPNGHIVPALIAGNCVIFKPSELAPGVAAETFRLWRQAGLPAGVLNLVQGGRATAEALLEQPELAGVLFTGGITAGLALHRRFAGRPDILLALELGGNNPLIAWDAADAEAAARLILRSAYISAGQRCTCARRLILPAGPAGDRLLAALLALLDRVRVGAPDADPAPFMGPLISAEAAGRVLAAQIDLVAAGARVLKAVARHPAGAAFLAPGLIDVTGLAERPDGEIFGPLLQVIRVADFDAALAESNATRFGLAAGLISDDPALYERFAAGIRAGIVNWNRPTTGASGAAPFGGVGLSGNHRPAGYYAADYCAYPVAGLIAAGERVADDEPLVGVDDGRGTGQ